MRRDLFLSAVLSAAALFLFAACPTSGGGGSGSCSGDEGCQCYTDGTCEDGLTCVEEVCVAGENADASGTDVGSDLDEDVAPDVPVVDLQQEPDVIPLEIGDEPDLSTDDADGPTCAVVGEPCDPGQAQPPDWVCAIEDNPAEGICLNTCVDTCAEGLCLDNACWPTECSGFWEDDCGPDTDCVPMTATYNVCYDNGPTAAGDPCTAHDQCAEGLFCLGSACFAPECAPISETVTCANPAEECDPLGEGLNVGVCYEPCLPFAVEDTCSDGTWCFPTEREEVGGQIQGICFESEDGTAQLGDPCDVESTTLSDICVDGLICLSDGCAEFCDPESGTSDPGACGSEEYCIDLIAGTTLLPFGACIPSCTPWTDDHVAAGCEVNEWCMASLDETEGNVGFCEPAGGAAQGADCGTPTTVCEADLICLGTCETICDPDATEGGDGDTCEDGEACESVFLTTGEETEVGYCQPVCNHDEGENCSGGLTCVLWEFFLDATEDMCLDLDGGTAEGQNCPVGYEQYDVCNTFSMCDFASEGGPLVCYEACRTSEGAFGTSAHPDCTRPGAVCTDVWEIPDFGACN